MFIPNPLPKPPHSTYVFKVKGKDHFKIGMTSNRVHHRRNQIQSRRLRLEEYKSWKFQNYFAALEQQIIAYLQQFDFEHPYPWTDDWFIVDEPTMKVVIEIADQLVGHILKWEQANWGLDCIPLEGTAYFRHIVEVVWPEADRRALELHKDRMATLGLKTD